MRSGAVYWQSSSGTASSNVFHAGAPMAYGGLHGHFSEEVGLQDVSMDGTDIRAHACAAGAANSSPEDEALGRSKGGLGCKMHALCDALGMPIKFILTGGQGAECKQAVPLLENVKALAVLADKGYDTNELREWLKSQGIKAVIPPKSNRKDEIGCDYWHYKEWHAVECLFGKFKHYRRIALRYEKKAINYTNPNKFSLLPSPKGKGQDGWIHITTF